MKCSTTLPATHCNRTRRRPINALARTGDHRGAFGAAVAADRTWKVAARAYGTMNRHAPAHPGARLDKIA